VLLPAGDHATRLLFRESIQSQGPAVTRWLAWDPMHFVMVQRMLRGIRERAEGNRLVPLPVSLAARVGWMLAGAGLLALFLSRRRRWPWLALPLLLALGPLAATGDWDAALVAFLATGITIAGALVFGRRWWPLFAIAAAGVLLILLLAPDAHTAFGLVFAVTGLLVVAGILHNRPRPGDLFFPTHWAMTGL
jgi:hypothetical protein